jgi:hypothetical protein
VVPGDTVQFSATGASAPPHFAMVFQDANRYWQSPFDPFENKFTDTTKNGNTSYTDNLTVGDVTDTDKVFQFWATTADGSKKSAVYTITVVS